MDDLEAHEYRPIGSERIDIFYPDRGVGVKRGAVTAAQRSVYKKEGGAEQTLFLTHPQPAQHLFFRSLDSSDFLGYNRVLESELSMGTR